MYVCVCLCVDEVCATAFLGETGASEVLVKVVMPFLNRADESKQIFLKLFREMEHLTDVEHV